jgi:hypothetical protein
VINHFLNRGENMQIEIPVIKQYRSTEAPTAQSGNHTEDNDVTDAAIEAEANRIIAATCAKHGLDPSELPPGATEDARRAAKETIEREAAKKANPIYAELEQEREKTRLLQAQVNALKSSHSNAASDRRPAITADAARAQVGEMAWNHQMTDAQRLQVIGVDPATVDAATRQEIMDVFGPKSDPHRASDLKRSNSFRYRQLKEVGRALRLI